MGENSDIIGRKVFFLYPHSVLQNEILESIIENEYEAYLLSDHDVARKLLRRFNDSIAFVNIDEALSEPDWESYIRSLIADEATAGVRIGILSFNEDPKLMKKYLMDIGVPCGYTRLRIGVAESTRIILTSLHANEAKGRRKFVRASTHGSDRATFNVRFEGRTVQGHVWDVSTAGMAVTFDDEIDLEVKTVLADMQLKLWGTLVRVHGVVTAKRSGPGGGFVVMFGKGADKVARRKIHSFVHRWLQMEMEEIAGQL